MREMEKKVSTVAGKTAVTTAPSEDLKSVKAPQSAPPPATQPALAAGPATQPARSLTASAGGGGAISGAGTSTRPTDTQLNEVAGTTQPTDDRVDVVIVVKPQAPEAGLQQAGQNQAAPNQPAPNQAVQGPVAPPPSTQPANAAARPNSADPSQPPPQFPTKD
jgi:hypothetical protein